MKTKKRSLFGLAVGLVAMTSFLWAQSVQAQSAPKNEFLFGCALPLTGMFGQDGHMVRNAYLYWQDAVNARGGIDGKYKIKIIFYDDQSNPQTSAMLINKLITQDKVDMLLGGYGSSQVMAASAVAERHEYPLISGAASSNMLFTRGFKYYFSTLGKSTEEVRGCVDVLTSVTPKPETVAIIGANIPFTADACQGYKEYAKKDGFKITHFELFPIGLQDYDTLLEKVKATHPDTLLVGSDLDIALSVVKAMKEIKFSPKAVGFSYGPTVPRFIQDLGPDANYVFAASEWTPNMKYKDDLFGTAAQFNAGFTKRFHRAPDYVEAATAAGAEVLQIAVEKLGLKPGMNRADRVKLMKELHKLNVMTFYGPIHFGKDGANSAHPPVAVQVQNQKLVNVYPSANAEAAPLYPMPPWKDRK